MPRSYRKHLEWTPSRIIHWAGTVGPSTTQMVERIMTERPHPEQGFRACLGILRLGKRYSEARLEKACARALACRSHSYRAVESILKNGLEDTPLPTVEAPALPVHENVRGSSYFNSRKGTRHVDPADDRETLRAQAPRNGRGARRGAGRWLPVPRSRRSPRHPRRCGEDEPRQPAPHAPAPGSPVPRRSHRRGDRLPASPQAREGGRRVPPPVSSRQAEPAAGETISSRRWFPPSPSLPSPPLPREGASLGGFPAAGPLIAAWALPAGLPVLRRSSPSPRLPRGRIVRSVP